MPIVDIHDDQSWNLKEVGDIPNYEPTLVLRALPVSSSEAAVLGGKKAQTPLLAGSICGSVMGAAWIIGGTIYFLKRRRRKARDKLIAEGKEQPTEQDLKLPKDAIIIPPDPAVLAGTHRPGEHVFPDRNSHSRQNSRTGPLFHKSTQNTPAEELSEALIVPPRSASSPQTHTGGPT